MRTPTVKLQHRRSGKKIKLDARDYARNIGRWKDWKIIYVREGEPETMPGELKAHFSEMKAAQFRAENPQQQHIRGDKARAVADRRVTHEVITTKAEDPPEATPAAPEAPGASDSDSTASDGWRTLPWMRRRKHVFEVTGTRPKNMEQAVELMAAHETKKNAE